MTQPIVWPGSGSVVSGSTPYGYYDNDPIFQTMAPKVADYCARSLGYPILDVELLSSNFYSAFESAITEYSAQVNQFNMRENMMSLQGTSTSGSISQLNVIRTPLGQLISVSRQYGTEALVGGDVLLKKGWVDMKAGVATYDLTVWAAVSESGNSIEIRRIFHDRTPAISRGIYGYGGGDGSGQGTYGLNGEFGWAGWDGGGAGSVQGLGSGNSFIVMPVFETLLRTQAVEFNDQIRRSAFSFDLQGGGLRIFPVPTEDVKLYFDYYVESDKFSSGYQTGVSDASNAPYGNIQFATINDVGRMWISRYTLALSKEMLGSIRAKYQTIPIPGAEVTMNGESLVQQAQQEKEQLIAQLRETLEQTGRKAQMDKERENAESMQKIFSKVPTLIYIR